MKLRYVLLALILCFSFAVVHAESYDFVLNLYGNANLDGTIDNKDIEYVKAVLEGKETPTKFSDANNDGKVDENDVTQIEQIIDWQRKSTNPHRFRQQDRCAQDSY